MDNSFLPNSDAGGVTTAVNETVGAASVATAIGGPAVRITIASEAGAYIRFGKAGTGAVTTANGFHLEAGSTTIWSTPRDATHVLHIREAAVSSAISMINGIAGT